MSKCLKSTCNGLSNPGSYQNACRQRPHSPHSLQWLPCCTTRNENLNKEAEQQHKTI